MRISKIYTLLNLLIAFVACSKQSLANIVDNSLMSYAERNVPWSEHNTDIKVLRPFLKSSANSVKIQFLTYAYDQKDVLPVEIADEVEAEIGALIDIAYSMSPDSMGRELGYLVSFRAEWLLAYVFTNMINVQMMEKLIRLENVSPDVFQEVVSLFDLINKGKVLNIEIQRPNDLLIVKEALLRFRQNEKIKFWTQANYQIPHLPMFLQSIIVDQIGYIIWAAKYNPSLLTKELGLLACFRAEWIRILLSDCHDFSNLKDKIDLNLISPSVFEDLLVSFDWTKGYDIVTTQLRSMMSAFKFMSKFQQKALGQKISTEVKGILPKLLSSSSFDHYITLILPYFTVQELDNSLAECKRIGKGHHVCAYLLTNYFDETSQREFCVSLFSAKNYFLMFKYLLPAAAWPYVKSLNTEKDKSIYIDDFRWIFLTSEDRIRGFLDFAADNDVLVRVFRNWALFVTILLSGVALKKDEVNLVTEEISTVVLGNLAFLYTRNIGKVLEYNARIKKFLDANVGEIAVFGKFSEFLKEKWANSWITGDLLK